MIPPRPSLALRDAVIAAVLTALVTIPIFGLHLERAGARTVIVPHCHGSSCSAHVVHSTGAMSGSSPTDTGGRVVVGESGSDVSGSVVSGSVVVVVRGGSSSI